MVSKSIKATSSKSLTSHIPSLLSWFAWISLKTCALFVSMWSWFWWSFVFKLWESKDMCLSVCLCVFMFMYKCMFSKMYAHAHSFEHVLVGMFDYKCTCKWVCVLHKCSWCVHVHVFVGMRTQELIDVYWRNDLCVRSMYLNYLFFICICVIVYVHTCLSVIVCLYAYICTCFDSLDIVSLPCVSRNVSIDR